MSQRRVTATNQLSTVVDAIQLGRRTGTLTIERGEGATFEEGSLTFVQGRLVQAIFDSLPANQAASQLLSWQVCRFAFVPTEATSTLYYQSSPASSLSGQGMPISTPTTAYGTQPSNMQSQDILHRKPSLAVYKVPMDDILRSLELQGFSRTHRRLLLLIDGRRSIYELAPLIGRSPEETLTLLTELAQAGLIQLCFHKDSGDH